MFLTSVHKVESLELRLHYRDYPFTSMRSNSLVCLASDLPPHFMGEKLAYLT